jgi:phosphoserine phosphatase RsbU/P
VTDPIQHAADVRLRRILALTDAALVGMDVRALFAELLDRLRALVGADTGAIMLLNSEVNQLVTVAAVVPDEDMRLDVRIDVGAGLLGRIALTGEPMIIDAVDDALVASPLRRYGDVTNLVGVPMLAGQELVGVLHLGRFGAERFTEQDVALLQLVADRAALASQARQLQSDRSAALALQLSLLPSHLPKVDGLDLAARYLPGHNLSVGGDWFDVFLLPSGYLGAVIGDVSGHGLAAAVVMGRLRSALRAYALEWDDPAEVLTRLDRKISHFETGSIATIIYAMVSPARDQVAMSSAGHLPPVIMCGEEPRLLTLARDLPVGVGEGGPRRTTVVDAAPETTLVLYTDGLVERRGEVIDAGIERLRRLVRPGPAEDLCSAIIAGTDMLAVDDDVAVVAMRTVED